MTAKSPKALLVVAVRPNFIKMKPVLDALEAIGITCVLVHTGQHYDSNLSDVFFQDLGMRQPDVSLNIGSSSNATQIAQVMVSFEKVVEEQRPDLVVVVGDVNSTTACSMVGAHYGALVAHVEAGLRSRDWDMPEEINRVVTDRVSDLLFAPSFDAADNLRSEGYREDQIHVVGNMMIDSLQNNLHRASIRPILAELELDQTPFGLVTVHRPSNVDDPETLLELLQTLQIVAEKIPLIVPLHPRTKVTMTQDARLLNLLEKDGNALNFVSPLGYLDFICVQSAATLVLTDSGGIQEETTALGVPCLTLRENTERPITIHEGTNQLVGTDRDNILNAVTDILLNGVSKKCPELWDGKAGVRCAEIILSRIREPSGLRPTHLAL